MLAGRLLLLSLVVLGTLVATPLDAHIVPPWAEHLLEGGGPEARAAATEADGDAGGGAGAGASLSLEAVRAVPVLVEVDGLPHQLVEVDVANPGPPGPAELEVGDLASAPVALTTGEQTLEIEVPAVTAGVDVTVRLLVAGGPTLEQAARLEPVRPWRVHLLPHSHVDIGFTAPQDEVEADQWRFFERAIEVGDETADHPEGARFAWNSEVLWAVESYLAQATAEEQAAFAGAVAEGVIGLDALFTNALTGLHSREQLVHLLDVARALRRSRGFPIDAAMLSDLPGAVWGLVPVLADGGVRYLSIGANQVRVGNFYRTWSDRPFYWSDPTGEKRVLCWIAGKGYNFFVLKPLRSGERVVRYLYELEQSGYPYDVAALRYVLFDNAGPDLGLADFVRDWNATHLAPELVISTTREPFAELEARFADQIPVVTGDLTPYWEDGAGSTAHETALNRRAAERLVQAERMFAIEGTAAFPADRFAAAWKNTLLFDEHTWGSIFSIVAPDDPATVEIWETKRSYALEADRLSRELLAEATAEVPTPAGAVEAIRVYNTSSWPRSDLVVVPADWSLAGDQVRTTKGRKVRSQRLASGELAFVAKRVPALGARTYRIRAGKPRGGGRARAKGLQVGNKRLRVEIDPATGAIASLQRRGLGELVDDRAGLGLNEYLYVEGRLPDAPLPAGPVSVSVQEPGPLVATLRIESPAPGARSLVREVRVVHGLDRVEITNHLDKLEVFEPEAVQVAFPFRVPDGVVRMDQPWAVVEPDLDQLDGSNKNHFTVQSWVDVSNERFGVTWASLDAPLAHLGAILADAEEVGYVDEVGPTTALYSFAMNNYWFTNFKAAQPGEARFRYAIAPHGPFDAAAAARFGEERAQPFVLLPVADTAPVSPPLRVWPRDVQVSALVPSGDGEGFLLRLFGASDRDRLAFVYRPGRLLTLRSTGPDQEPGPTVSNPIRVPARGGVTLWVEAP